MQTAGRMVILVTLVAILAGGILVFYKNGFHAGGMFGSNREANLKSNANYYSHVDKKPGAEPAEPFDASEGY